MEMESCSVTLRNGQTTRLENVFIRGSKIRFLVLPDMLKNAPMFANMTAGNRGRGSAGSGKSAILRAQAARGRGRGRGGGRGWGPGGPMRR
ncbi:small nuclear ribonucleoprotein Sm D3-like [Hyalella azteca]|uniref:Small nuclear ribonucleoprotein Sm D3-like n=1 Tax=Hyalella azteca TaxID=294128 RepID=A0A8B7PIY5_HYAAZ|nr:small nuclear ribonucleoprotein Sm D3-like [Hyalella azteca]